MKKQNAVSPFQMAKRILDREDNTYKEEIVQNVVKMYVDEIQKALLSGERVLIAGVGTIIPEVKTHIGNYNLAVCNNYDGNPPPYTHIRMTRTYKFCYKMNAQLLNNIKKGIYGLKKLPFDIQQLNILKKSGYVPEDAVIMEDVEE